MEQFLKPNKNKIIISLILLSPTIIIACVEPSLSTLFFWPIIFSIWMFIGSESAGSIGLYFSYFIGFIIYVFILYFISCLVDFFVNKISGKSK